MTKPDGGPAFPLSGYMDSYGNQIFGMSLRDWFAGKALTGFCATLLDVPHIKFDLLARDAYAAADAMLAARENRDE